MSREKSDVLELLPHIQALLADFTGRKISINITEVQAKHIEKRVQYLLTSFTDLVQRTTATSDENKKKEYLKRFLEVFGEFFFHIPPCEQSVNRLIEQISEPFNLENRKFFTNTRFLVYKNSMFSIIDRIARRKKYPEFRNLVNTISKEDLIIMAQHTISINQKASFLLDEHKRLTENLLEKYCEIYRILCEHMEIMITTYLYATYKIIKRKEFDYEKIKNSELRDNVNSLRNDRDFRKFMSPFNVIIRNSLSHGSKKFEPLLRRIIFTDRKERVGLSYSTFVQQTREMYASVYVVSHMQDAVNSYVYTKFGEYLQK